MAQDLEVMQDAPSNPCCATLKKKHAKLLEKYSKLEVIKNNFRHCTALVQEKYDVIEKENESLKKALEELEVQAKVWRDEKENEACRRTDLEDEVSALRDEVRSLKQNSDTACKETDKQLQEHLIVAEKEMKGLKQLLDQERGRAALGKKNAELEKKKANEALKKVSALQDEVRLLKQNSNSACKETNDQLQERLIVAENEIKGLKQLLDEERGRAASEKKNAELEKKKADEALKKVETGKNKVSEAQKVASVEKKKAEQNRLLSERLKKEIDDMKSMLALEKSKSEASEKKVEVEKQKAIRERKRADLAVAKSEEQRELAETNLKKATFEKDRADDLNRKLEEAKNRAEKLEGELRKHICSGGMVKAQDYESINGRNTKLTIDVCKETPKNDARFSQWMEKMLLEKEHNIIREKKRADSEKKKARKQRKVAEEHKKMAMEQKYRADQLSRELESCQLRLEELRKELQEFVSCRVDASSAPLRNNKVISETDTVKLLKKQLKLEKLLVKHAKKATKVEAVRNKMLHQELCHLKQECIQFQQRLDILDKSFLHGSEGIDQLGKIGNQTPKRKILCLDGCHRQLISGTDTRTDPPTGGSNQKMLKSSAINSSLASFSDRQLVGSQERGSSSVLTSAILMEDTSNLEPAIERLSDKMSVRYKHHGVVNENNSMRSPAKDGANKRRVGYRERKKILDAVESVGNLYSKGEELHRCLSEKLSLLHGILNGQKDADAEEENLKENSHGEVVRPFKKRKTSSEGKVFIHHLQDSVEPQSMLESDIGHSDACMPTSSPGFDVVKFHCPFKDVTDGAFGRKQCRPQYFDEMVTCDYMKLLELDNAADETSYRQAIDMPLSPILPEVQFDGDEILEVDNREMLVCESSQEWLSIARDNPVSVSSFNSVETEKNPTNLVSNCLIPSQFQTAKDLLDFSENVVLLPASDADSQQIHVLGEKSGISDLSGAANEGTSSTLCKNGIGSSYGGRLKYLVASSDNRDNSSILRILQTINSCMPLCSFIHSPEMFLRRILHTLLKAEDLSIKEKACVFFSLLLHEFSEVGLKNLTNVLSDSSVQTLDAMTIHIKSALCDPVLRRIFMESCDLFELLSVIEDFLLQSKVLVCGDVSDESEILTALKLILTLNGNAIMLSEAVASPRLLVAGGSMLASLCSAIDHVGFACEVSSNIIRLQKFKPPVMLAVLHSFARICGSKYFTLQQYSVTMTVVKSVVMFLEKHSFSTDSTSFFPSEVENPSKIWSCSTCPFSEGAISVEGVAVLLLENLRKQCCSESWPQDSLALVDLLVPRLWSHEKGTEDISGLREAVPLSSTSDEKLYDFIDMLSLVEVLATFMGWNWTSDHLIGQMCEYLESHLMEGFSAAIIILLGQLGRRGVGANGYENPGVKKIRGLLSAFVCETTFVKLSLFVQFAIITSLFGLTPLKLDEIVEGKVEASVVMSHSVPCSSIREWFVSLSHEQQSFLRLHQAASESNY